MRKLIWASNLDEKECIETYCSQYDSENMKYWASEPNHVLLYTEELNEEDLGYSFGRFLDVWGILPINIPASLSFSRTRKKNRKK